MDIIKTIVIVGPTSTGKSDLGVELAKKFDGEIISADSRQVYKGMNIGTGKVTRKEMKNIPHHMLDVVTPGTTYNAAKFKKNAERIVLDIHKRNKVPFVVGGTGFWIDSLIFDSALPEVPPNKELRTKLERKTNEQLLSMLQKLDLERASNIDTKNKRRLIRAIEIAKGKPQERTPRKFELQPLFIGLDMDTEKLYERIDQRLDKRVKKGMIKEVEKLHSNGLSWRKLDDMGLEYRFISRYLKKDLSKEQMTEQLSFAIKHYAKRQRTWFKRNKDITWLNPNKKSSAKKAERLVKIFLLIK